MRKGILPTGMLVALMVASSFAAPEKATTTEYFVVQVTGHAGKATNFVMTAQEKNAIMGEVEAEAKVFQKAVQLAEQDWKSDASTSDKAFSRGAISPKKAKVLGKYTDENKAYEKSTSATERILDRAKAEEKRIDEHNKTLKLSDTVIKERQKKQTAEESRGNLARLFFEKRLAELLGGATPAASTNKPAGQAQAPAPEQKSKEEKKK